MNTNGEMVAGSPLSLYEIIEIISIEEVQEYLDEIELEKLEYKIDQDYYSEIGECNQYYIHRWRMVKCSHL